MVRRPGTTDEWEVVENMRCIDAVYDAAGLPIDQGLCRIAFAMALKTAKASISRSVLSSLP